VFLKLPLPNLLNMSYCKVTWVPALKKRPT